MTRGMRAAAAAALLAIAVAGGPAMADYLMESWSVEGWEGGAYRNDDTGDVYCALGDDYGRGTVLWLGRNETGFYINLTDPEDFDLQPDTSFWTSLRIDERYSADVEAYVMDQATINIDFGSDRKAIDALANGEKLYFDEWDLWYTLYGTQRAIPALENCYAPYN